MKILIVGADGQLGTDLGKVIPPSEQIPLTIKELDITGREQALSAVKKHSPDVVINTAAYHRVDDCEDHPDRAFAVNAEGVKNLAEACREADAALVHVSTDYVFDGKKGQPYAEEDTPRPLSVYGASKLKGELYVKDILRKHFVVRSSGLYGAAGCMGKGGGNFAENMLGRAARQAELKVVTDEILSPTYTLDLAGKIYQLIKTRHYGLYHIVNHGQCSWFDFTVKLFELLGRKVKITPTTSADFKTKARRPPCSALKNAGLQALGMDDLRPWEEALKAYLIEKKYLS